MVKKHTATAGAQSLSGHCEVETCVVDPGSDVGSSKFCAACFEESEHVVHGCALRDLGRMCMDVREAQTCDTTLEQVSKSRQTHEHCVAEDLVLKPGSEAVRDASRELKRYVEGSCTAKLSFVPPGHRRAGCGLIDVLTSVMLLAKAQLCIAVSELFSAAVIILVSCSCAWTGEILSCRRMERALIGLRIPFWLKIAVVFATALCIRAEGVQPCCPAVGLKAEGIQPGCVAIGIRSEEAKPLSSDYVCSLSSYCCRDGSFEDFGYGSAACSQPNSIQDYEQGRYKGVSTPLRRCHVRPFGVARREAFIKSTKQCFSGGGSHVALVCGAPMDQPEMISGPPTLSRLWVGVTSPSLAASIALERSLWINQLHHPCVQKTSVFAYLVMKFAGPAQDNCGRAVCLPSQKARSALVYLTSTDLDSVEEGAPAKRRRISSVGVITDEVQKRLLERLSKGYLGAYLWESGIRGQDVENCLKAERRSGVAVLAISALQNCLSLRNEPCLPGCVGGSEPEDCGVQVAGYDACILGYDPTYSTFGSSSCGFAGGSSIESCAPGERGFGIRYGIITPDAAGFQHPWGGVLYACGWSYNWRREESRPPHQWNYPIYEGKGEDMRLQMSKGIGKGRLPAYENEYPLPKPPSVPPLPNWG